MDANGEDQERLLHSRSPGARKSALSLLIGVHFAFIGGSLSDGGFTDFGLSWQLHQERFHAL